jgi:hypothetical protein
MIDAEELIEQIKNSNGNFRSHQCRHTLPEGRRCGSPAMRGEKFCYYHHETRKPVADPQRRQARRNCFHIAPPRTRAAIQDSIGEIVARLAYNEIHPRRAGLLLYALQIATTNIKDHQASQQPTAKDSAPEQCQAESNDPAQDTFDAEVFPRTPVTPESAAALYESLTRNHTPEPHTESPEDRKPGSPTSEILPALHAAVAPRNQTSSLSWNAPSRPDPIRLQPRDSEEERLASLPEIQRTQQSHRQPECLPNVSGLSFHRINSFHLSILAHFATSGGI